MQNVRTLHNLITVVVLACCCSDADAQQRTSAMRLVPEKNSIGIDVKLSLHRVEQAGARLQRTGDVADGDALTVNSLVSICVQASESGFITLWADTGDRAVMILPNLISTEIDRALPVTAGQAKCVGEGTAAYRFRVDKPTGQQRLIAHWTATLEDSVPTDAYVSLDDGTARSAGGAEVTKTLIYEVVQ